MATISYHQIHDEIAHPGLWNCFVCGLAVLEWPAPRRWQIARHHKNGDQSNNAPENLVPSHMRCHTLWHHKESGRMTEESFARTVTEGKRLFHQDLVAIATRSRTVSSFLRTLQAQA